MNTPHIIVREVPTGNLAVFRIPVGWTAELDPDFRWAGFFPSRRKAMEAIDEMSDDVRKQLYGEPRPVRGTPGPKSVSELFKISW